MGVLFSSRDPEAIQAFWYPVCSDLEGLLV